MLILKKFKDCTGESIRWAGDKVKGILHSIQSEICNLYRDDETVFADTIFL